MSAEFKMQRVDSLRWQHLRIMAQVKGESARDLCDRYFREGLERDGFPLDQLTPLQEGRRHRVRNYVKVSPMDEFIETVGPTHVKEWDGQGLPPIPVPVVKPSEEQSEREAPGGEGAHGEAGTDSPGEVRHTGPGVLGDGLEGD